jgi:hypothetical protein
LQIARMAVKAGRAEVKKFRVAFGRRVVSVAHYRMKAGK